jgi:NNP family nitrate/nitrite transporter-like MFS transporter
LAGRLFLVQDNSRVNTTHFFTYQQDITLKCRAERIGCKKGGGEPHPLFGFFTNQHQERFYRSGIEHAFLFTFFARPKAMSIHPAVRKNIRKRDTTALQTTSSGNHGNTGSTEGTAPLRSQMRPIALLTTIFFLNFTARIVLSPLMPTIEKELKISHGEAGSLFLFVSVGYVVALLCAGMVSCRLFHRKTIVLSATAVGMTLVAISFSRDLTEMRLGFLLLGMAAGLYLPSGIATLTSLIRAADWGKGLALHEIAPNLGFVAAPIISETLLSWFSWREILVFIGGVSVCAGLAFAFLGRGGEFPGETLGVRSCRQLLGQPAFWMMALLFSAAICGSLGVFAMLPLFLVAEGGMDRNGANTLVALSRISGLGMGFAAGWMSDRVGPKRIMKGVLLLTGIMTVLLGTVSGQWLVIMVFLQPMLAVCFFPPGFAALSSIGSAGGRNVAVSLTVPLAFLIGGGVVPAGIGIMGDAGAFGLGMALSGGFILTGFLVSRYLKLPGRK